MKRIISVFIALISLSAVLSGCGTPEIAKTDEIRVVCTIFPQYDWVRQITSDEASGIDLTLLLSNKIDLHNYQPTVDDIVRISSCDLFIYVGGESDGWVEEALRDAANKNMVVISLLDVLGDELKEEIALEGMQADESDEWDNGETDYDEHVWLSLNNAAVFCSAIADALSSLDINNAGEYTDRAAAYIKELLALDAEYRAVVNVAFNKSLLFGDRFPFRYLTDDYGLTPYAAFSGCSAETEAGFETIIFLANKADELGLGSVLVTESADQSIARTIISNTKDKNQRILVLDSMQSTTLADAVRGKTYLSAMQSNMDVLKEALK